ncbi:MAG TPA: peptidoglycan-associated lipoprotein Pal [Candidatus Tenderia sp.]|nr:peptidoglycan-associated lipoprotein Pal [Candidatus Tenderia sp.]
MSAFAKGLAVLLSVAVLWGCSSKTSELDSDTADAAASGTDSSAAVEVSGADSGTEISGAEISGMSAGNAITADPFNDPANLLSTQTIYFDFDRSDIKADARAVIEAHARYLADNPNVRVTLEGHTDERGTREYNLALGERRAVAVRQMMALLGVSSRQIDVVSYGEEKPAVLGHDESAWSKNRRVVIVYSGR